MKNWSGYHQWNPLQIFKPKAENEITQIVQKAIQENKKIRLIGSGHSFTPLSKTDDFLVSLDDFQGIISIDKSNKQVTVKAGTKLNHLNKLLDKEGLALENLGDIDVQSIAGAISTGTHGTGINFGNLCTQVRKLKFVNGKGEIITCSLDKNPETFKAAVLSLGTMGILTEITLQCVSKYNLQLFVRKKTLDEVLQNLNEYNSKFRHFEFYWFPNTDYVMTKELNVTKKEADKSSFGEYVQEMLLENYAFKVICEMSYRFPSTTRSVSKFAANTISDFQKIKQSFKVFSTSRIVRFNEMEYNVPAEAYQDVIKDLTNWINKNNKDVMFPIENRFVQKDDIYLSPAYQRDSAYISVHVYNKKDFTAYFKALEEIFTAYHGRPHWGKMHTRRAEHFAQLYPKFEEFNSIRAEHDPNEMFLSPYMKSICKPQSVLS